MHERDKKNTYKILIRKLKGKKPLGRLGARMWSGFIWLRTGTTVKYLDYLNNCLFCVADDMTAGDNRPS
jgi:hypothetical protein